MATMKDRFYIAGPMSGKEDFNYPAFFEAEQLLRAYGYDVINPARQFDGNIELSYETYIRVGIQSLLRCSAIYMLEGWEWSNGAKLEFMIAKTLMYRIDYQQPDGSRNRASLCSLSLVDKKSPA